MGKSTMATRLPRRLEENMKIVGEQIKLARLRRNLSRAQVAERAMCSELTEARVEKGSPTVAIGTYLRILYALQLEDDILLIAKDDIIGRELQDISLINRWKSQCSLENSDTKVSGVLRVIPSNTPQSGSTDMLA